MKHGLTGDGPVVDAAAQSIIEARKAAWSAEFPRSSDLAAWTYGKLVAASVQLDRSGSALSVHRAEHAERSTFAWDEDRRLEAEEVAARLAKDPSRTVGQLRATQHGIDVMLARWSRLADALDATGDWTEAERSHALDLLGIPADLRRGRTPLDVPEGVDAREFLQGRIAAEADELVRRRDQAFSHLDSVGRRNASHSYGAELTKDGRLLRRYEREALSRFLRHRRDLLHQGNPAVAPPAVEPRTDREPEPDGPAHDDSAPIFRALGADPADFLGRPEPEESGPEEEIEPEPAARGSLTVADSERVLGEVLRHHDRMEKTAIVPPSYGTGGANRDRPKVAADGTTAVDLFCPGLSRKNRRERRAEKARARRAGR